MIKPDEIVQVGGLVPTLVGLTPLSDGRILDGFYLALINRRIQVGDRRYEVREVFFDSTNKSKVMARLRLLSD
jgi:hypothetical protein